MMGLAFLGGIILGALILYLPALITVLLIDEDDVRYKAGYEDGYEKGKRET